MNPRISVVIPAHNAEKLIADAVRAVIQQPLARDQFECLVVDDGSTDRTGEIAAKAGAIVVSLKNNSGIAGARNAGVQQARGEWIAFTDSDCVPSRRWLTSIFAAIETTDRSTIALAGKTIGLDSNTPAAKFMDLIGALDAENYLRSEVLPWSPGCNLAYRREDLLAIGGFDSSFKTYETADFHLRVTERFGGSIKLLPAAVVLHRHRPTWRGLWKQQYNYGYGYAQFLRLYADRWPWSVRREAGAWLRVFGLAFPAAIGRGEKGLVQRGWFVKQLAHRLGFVSTYYSARSHKQVAALKPSA
ncbi:MAG TPA: glycosyltransferase [Verrucomicrobiae bacterium]|nr:glycosyltransferase [Verrucomicrobiae bacterium]